MHRDRKKIRIVERIDRLNITNYTLIKVTFNNH